MAVKQASCAIAVSASVGANGVAWLTQTLAYTGALDPGNVLEIDCNCFSALKNAANARMYLSGPFFQLGVGSNELTWTDAEGSRTIGLQVTRAPRY